MFGFITSSLIILLSFISKNQSFICRYRVIDLDFDKLRQGFHHQVFTLKLDKYNAISCNNFDYLSHKICVPDKTENVNISVSNIITEKNMNPKHQ